MGIDVLVAQGSDSGGHGTACSASIISLVPELVSSFPEMPVFSCGIVDASVVLASLALGAEGVVIGTRFAASTESAMADNAKSLILKRVTEELQQNGNTMVSGIDSRTRICDILRGKGNWLATHNGRAIINETLREHESGVPEHVLQEKYDIAMKEKDYNRLVVYAGTGLGLVTKKQTVAEILDEVEMQFTEKVKLVNERLEDFKHRSEKLYSTIRGFI